MAIRTVVTVTVMAVLMATHTVAAAITVTVMDHQGAVVAMVIHMVVAVVIMAIRMVMMTSAAVITMPNK